MDLHIPDDRCLVNYINRNVKFDRIKRLDLATNGQTYTVAVNSKAKFRNITEFKPGHRAVADDVKHKFITGILYTLLITGFVIGLIAGVVAGLKDANQLFYSSLAGAIAGAFTAPIHIYSIIKDDEEVNSDIDSIRLFSVRLLAVILASGLIGAISNTNSWATMGAIGGSFVGILIARVSNRAVNFKYIAKVTVFAISLGALVGTGIGAAGGTIPGTISGAITAGVVAIVFNDLEAFFRTVFMTETFGEMVKIVVGIIMILPREDINAIVIGVIIGAIMNNSPIVLGHGALFGAVAGAIFATANYIKRPNISYPTRFLYSIICLRYIKNVFGIGASGAVGGLMFAAFIGILLAHRPGNPLFDVFRYKIIFAAIAGLCAGAGVLAYFLPTYIISLICALKVSFPELVGRPVIVAIAGAAAGGYLLAAVVNTAGLRVIDRVSTRFINRTISAIRGILRTINVSIFLGAIGAIFGTISAGTVELIAGEKLTGAITGAILGAITGIASGVITIIAMAIVRNITVPAITKMSTDREIEIIVTIGGFIGGVFGGHFTSNIVAGSLVALTFPIVTTVIYTAPLYIERRHRFKRVKRISVINIMKTFGIELRYLTNQETQNSWLLYKIPKAP